MFLILGLLSMVGIITVEYFLGVYADFTILGFSLGVVFPVGCYFIGGVVATIISKGIKKSGKKINISHYILAIVIVCVTFFASGFVWYAATYADKSVGFNVNRKGVPIRDLQFVDLDGNDIEMTYMNYFTYQLDESNTEENFKDGSKLILKSKEVEKVPTYLIQVVALVLSTVLTLKGIMYNENYCEICHMYYKKKKLFKFSRTNYNNELSELKDRIRNKDNLKDYIDKHREPIKESFFYRAQLEYCKNCNSGHIVLKSYEKQNLRLSEIKDEEVLLEIDNETVDSIL